MISRRSILRAIPALLAAPAIVRASSLMAISPLPRYENLIFPIGDIGYTEALATSFRETKEFAAANVMRDLLLPGVRKIHADYQMIETQWAKVFANA